MRTYEIQCRRDRSWFTYAKHALLHPYNLPLLVVVMTVGAISGNLMGLFIAVGAELTLLATVSRLRFFRRHIEEMLEQLERTDAAKVRAHLMLRMDEKHRQELETLEMLVDKTRSNLMLGGGSCVAEDGLGLGRLLASYVRLAIAYRRDNESLNAANRQVLATEIATLEQIQDNATERTRQLAARRLEIARRRAERWDRTREDLDAVVQQIAMIRELIHLMHEQSTAAVNIQEATNEIDHFITDLEGREGMMREIAELSEEDRVDHRILEMGRAAPLATN